MYLNLLERGPLLEWVWYGINIQVYHHLLLIMVALCWICLCNNEIIHICVEERHVLQYFPLLKWGSVETRSKYGGQGQKIGQEDFLTIPTFQIWDISINVVSIKYLLASTKNPTQGTEKKWSYPVLFTEFHEICWKLN